jgi:chromosome segregation ATPase
MTRASDEINAMWRAENDQLKAENESLRAQNEKLIQGLHVVSQGFAEKESELATLRELIGQLETNYTLLAEKIEEYLGRTDAITTGLWEGSN